MLMWSKLRTVLVEKTSTCRAYDYNLFNGLWYRLIKNFNLSVTL